LKSTTRAIFIASIALSTALPQPVSAQSGVLSEIVDGIQGRLWVSKSGDTLNETQLTDVYVELRNVSNGLVPIEIYYDTEHPILSCEVVDTEGHTIQQTASVASILQPFPFWLTLPQGGLLQFKVSVSGYGIPKRGGIMIQMPCGVWALKSTGQSQFLRATIRTQPRQEDSGHRAWHGTLSLPPAAIPIE
jgi:hypothetical protein